MQHIFKVNKIILGYYSSQMIVNLANSNYKVMLIDQGVLMSRNVELNLLLKSNTTIKVSKCHHESHRQYKNYLWDSSFSDLNKSFRASILTPVFIFLFFYYSCGLSTVTIEYSCPSVCVSVCLSVRLSVCLSVCVSVYTITQKIMVQLT